MENVKFIFLTKYSNDCFLTHVIIYVAEFMNVENSPFWYMPTFLSVRTRLALVIQC